MMRYAGRLYLSYHEDTKEDLVVEGVEDGLRKVYMRLWPGIMTESSTNFGNYWGKL